MSLFQQEQGDDDNKETYKSHSDLYSDAEFRVDTDTAFVRDLTHKMWMQDCVKSMSGEGQNLALTGSCVARAVAQHRRKQWQPSRREEEEGEREKGRKGQRGRGQEGREEEEEEREAEEGGGQQVEKDVTGWTEVTRNKRRKMIQMFVKVDGSRVTPIEVNLKDDKVDDMMRQVQKDEDACVTMHARVLKRSRICGVIDGCTIQVTSRLRGGGRKQDRKSGADKKKEAQSPRGSEQQCAKEPKSDERPAHRECNQDEVFQMTEASEEFEKLIMEESDSGEEERVRNYLTAFLKWLGWDEERMEEFGERIKRMVEKKRRGKVSGKAEQGQGKKVRFGGEKQPEVTQPQRTDEEWL